MVVHQPSNSMGNYAYNIWTYTSQCWHAHFHKNFEIIYVLQGCVCCTVNGRDYRLRAGDFGLCLPYDVHAYTPENDSKYWVLVFSEDYVRLFAKNVKNKTAKGFSFRCSLPVEKLVLEKLIGVDPPSVYVLKACLYALCDEFLQRVDMEESGGKKLSMRTIVDFVMENYIKDIHLSDIATLLGYDYHYVSRYFKTVFGMSFTDFMNIYRIEAAISLLEETDKKMIDIALESGFQTLRNFNTSFKKLVHMTPSEYRKSVYRGGEGNLSARP